MCIHVLPKKYKALLGPIKRALVKSANIRNTVSHFFLIYHNATTVFQFQKIGVIAASTFKENLVTASLK